MGKAVTIFEKAFIAHECLITTQNKNEKFDRFDRALWIYKLRGYVVLTWKGRKSV